MSCAGHGTRHVLVGYRKPIVDYLDQYNKDDDDDENDDDDDDNNDDENDDDDDESVRQLLIDNDPRLSVRQLLIDNDPRLTGYVADLSLSNYDRDEDYGYGAENTFGKLELQVAKSISANTHLRSLVVELSELQEDDEMSVVQDFFTWFVHNRSIEHLVLKNFEYSNTGLSSTLSSFIEHNHKLRCIEITGIGIVDPEKGSRWPGYKPLASVLISTISNKNRLERINLSDSNFEDNVLTELMDALRVTPGLHNLLDLCMGGSEISVKGCTALRNLLTTSECNIQVLGLERSYNLDNDCMDILVDGLVQNNTIISLNVAWLDEVSSKCWKKFSEKYLSTKAKDTKLKRIWLGKNNLNKACCSIMGRALVGINSLQVLDLCGTTTSITPTGWQQLTKPLTARTCIISELYLDSCTGSINDTGAAVIFSALANNMSLKILSMADNKSITANGWKAGFQTLSQYESNLSSLLFNKNDINYEGVTILVDWIATRASTVTQLELGQLCTNNDIPAITENEWCTFADVLQTRATLKLQSLRIGSNLSDEAATCLFHALAENSSLVILTMTFADLGFERSCWEVLGKALCDKSSFDSICNSNHTLEEVKVDARHEFSDLLRSHIPCLLSMNMDKNKSEVLRKKLLRYHFSDNIENVDHVFGPLEATLLPHAVAWIGRDRLGFGVMYKLFHDMPWLCNDCQAYEPSRKIRRVR